MKGFSRYMGGNLILGLIVTRFGRFTVLLNGCVLLVKQASEVPLKALYHLECNALEILKTSF